MKLTLTLLLVAVLAFTLPLVGCKKENTPPTNPTVNATSNATPAPADNAAPTENKAPTTENAAPANTTPKTPTTGPA